MAIRIGYGFALAGLIFACEQDPVTKQGGDAGLLASGGGVATLDASGETDSTSAMPSGFWTQSAPVTASQSPHRLFVLSEAAWVVGLGMQSVWITRDAGKTFVRLASGYDDTTRTDVVFHVAGVHSDGRLVAIWQHQDVCDTCAGQPSGPGSPGDAFLLAYDLEAARWDVVDSLPTAALGTRDAVASADKLWLFGSVIQRFDGPGAWVEVPRPVDHTGPFNNVAVTRDGTLYVLARTQVFVLAPGQAWQTLTMPTRGTSGVVTSGEALAVDHVGRLYVAYDGTDHRQISRRDGDAWTDVSPALTSPDSSEPQARGVYFEYKLAATLDGHVAAATVLYDATREGHLRYDPFRVFLSRDAGDTWVERSGGLPAQVPESIAFAPDGRPHLGASRGSAWVWTGLLPSEW